MIPASIHSSTHHVIGAGPALAMAHGAGGGFAANFTGLVSAMSGERTLIGIDYPGAGGRPRQSVPLRLDDLADELVETAVAAGFDRFPVLGMSLGSAVAQTAAVRHPDRVSALILTAGWLTPDASVRTTVAAWRALAALRDRTALGHLLVAACASGAALADLDEPTLAAAAAEVASTYPRGGEDHAALVLRADLRTVAPRITVPTLVVVPAEDRLVLPSSGRALAAAIAGAELVEIEGAGHIFDPAQERQWLALVRGFLIAHER